MSQKNEIPEECEKAKVLLPVLDNSTAKENVKCEPNLSYRRESSLRLPTLDSLYEFDEQGLSSRSSGYGYEETSGLGSTGSSEKSSKDARYDNGPRQKFDVVLEEHEEKEIARKVKKEFKKEFKDIRQQTREKQKILRKKFQSQINSARASLLVARANAERKAIDKLEEKAEKKEANIIKKRKERRNSPLKENPRKSLFGDTVSDLAALRKVRAELDRARARRRSTIASTILASRRFSLGAAVPDYETKKLENVEEVQKLVYDLQKLGLDNTANDLVRSLHYKKNSEQQMKETLKEEWKNARLKAMNKRDMEIQNLRQQKLEEKEMLERERIEREKEERKRLERERSRRQMEALRRKAFNISLRKSMEGSKLVTSISRPYTYSYFNPR